MNIKTKAWLISIESLFELFLNKHRSFTFQRKSVIDREILSSEVTGPAKDKAIKYIYYSILKYFRFHN